MSQSAKAGEPQEPTRRGRAAAVGNDALALATAALRRAGFPDIGLVTRWAEIAGGGVAAVAAPVRYQEGPNGAVLTLRCEPGATVFLQHETRALLGRINAFLGRGRVARIRLVAGELARKRELPNHPLHGRPALPQSELTGLPGALDRLGKLRQRLRK